MTTGGELRVKEKYSLSRWSATVWRLMLTFECFCIKKTCKHAYTRLHGGSLLAAPPDSSFGLNWITIATPTLVVQLSNRRENHIRRPTTIALVCFRFQTSSRVKIATQISKNALVITNFYNQFEGFTATIVFAWSIPHLWVFVCCLIRFLSLAFRYGF